MDQRTRKLMTMHKALHSRDDVNRLYVSRKEEGKRFASTENNIDSIDTMTWGWHRKTWRRTDYSHQNNTDNMNAS